MVAKESLLQKFEKKIHQEGQEKMIMDIYQKNGVVGEADFGNYEFY